MNILSTFHIFTYDYVTPVCKPLRHEDFLEYIIILYYTCICIYTSKHTHTHTTPTYGRAKAARSARTYIQQLCEDTGYSPEDLPEAMNDREKWRERVRDIRAGGPT